MLKRFSSISLALIASLVVPFVMFVLIISLNESSLLPQEESDKNVSFDVERQKKLAQSKPKPKPKPKRRQAKAKLPSMKPANIGSTLSGAGLSFGVPQFDGASFSDINDGSLLDSVAGKAMDNDTVDTAPRIKKRSPVVYPELARRQGISGYVIMNVLISEFGNVEEVEVVDSKPSDVFDKKASDTIRRWKFAPATYNGKQVKVWALQKIVFKLD